MKEFFIRDDYFSFYDLMCACIALLPLIAISVLIALVIIPPVSADTLIIYPDTDETVYNGTEATTSVIRNAPGEANYPVGADTLGDGIVAWSAASPNVDHLFRPIAIYNTSAIGGGSISSVVQSVFSESVTTGLGDPSFSITGGTPASYTSIAASDYNKFQNTEFITGTAYGSFPTWEYANFTFNAAGISYINKTGHTALYYRNTWDTQNDYTGYTWASGGETYLSIDSKDHSESGRRPFLTIVFTPGGSTPTPTPSPTPTWAPEINPPSPDSLIGTIKNWIKNFLKDVFE